MDARVNAGGTDDNPDPANQSDMQILKVRKPYTITKQRERWTEEEHGKFLEALRLYGRAWRRIEEHIGTKNAVQIRSHAQKFFSKVARDSPGGAAGGGGGDGDLIEIPPPRPKRRPTHPYPRKSNGAAVQPSGKTPVPILEPSAGAPPPAANGGSPTSVLSSAEASPDDEQEASPKDEQDNCGAGPSSSSCVDEERMLSSPIFAEKDRGDVGGGGNDKDQIPCLKLFGRTVIINDTQKPCTSSIGSTAGSCQPAPAAEEVDSFQQHYPAPRSPSATSNAAPFSFIPPQLFYCLPINDGDPSSGGAALPATATYWGCFYGNQLFSFVHPESVALGIQMSAEAAPLPAAAAAAVLEEDTTVFLSLSSSSSNSNSSSKGRKRASFRGLIPSEGSAFNVVKRGTPSRGFVPYNGSKRCVALVPRSGRV